MNVRLSHQLSETGELDSMWSTGPPFWAENPAGARLFVVRDKNVRALLRDHHLRDLSAVAPEHAVAGVTLGRKHAMLAIVGKEARQVRALTEPGFAPKAAAQYEQDIWGFAHSRMLAVRDGDDLVSRFAVPFVMDCIALLAGVDPYGLRELSDRTTGYLVREIPDHAVITRAWDELYSFTEEAIHTALSGWGDSMMPRVIQDMAGVLPAESVHHAATTIYNGFPTVLSAVVKLIEFLLDRLWLLQACREHPELIPGVVRTALKEAVHFTFGLPGVCTMDAIFDDYVIRVGTTWLPVFHGADAPAGFRGWGSPGLHACLGMHAARIILECTVRAMSRIRGIHLAVPWSAVTFREGTMPLAVSLPAAT